MNPRGQRAPRRVLVVDGYNIINSAPERFGGPLPCRPVRKRVNLRRCYVGMLKAGAGGPDPVPVTDTDL